MPRSHPRAAVSPTVLFAASLALIALLYAPNIARPFVDWSGWALAELHVNYAAGPVRRGLLGEIAFHLASLGIVTRLPLLPAAAIALTARSTAGRLFQPLFWCWRPRRRYFRSISAGTGAAGST